ncbi:iron ABC transporter permease [Terrihabitans rhizophilus]|uniref:Iron ABC transporter permease n=1 Tax=Terrihabitans rhizophilus TaxID=3092662 RepID=A0ABU4RJM7_9HYPH|nr:iron ABC transporter permease [Terrihabitans sp. PJ23]MDX6804761.1 iron ABC transporter permease [Terrihabitans sp. PJ23]
MSAQGGRPVAGDRSAAAAFFLILLAVLTAAVAVVSLGTGPAPLPVARVVEILLAGPASGASGDGLIIWQIRVPRILIGSLVGATLAVSGALMQGLFRNPLADPGLVGVSSGAALGAVSTIVYGGTVLLPLTLVFGSYAIAVAAFVMAFASTLLLYAIATRGGRTSIATMLLAGIALGAFSAAATGLLVFTSSDQQLRDITFWSLGGLGGASWNKLAVAGPIMLAVLLAMPVLARGLNAYVLGEAEAFHLGVHVQRLKFAAIFLVAAGTGAAVATSGVIGFVGIVVPHLLRLAMGPNHQPLLPACAMGGAVLLLVADMVARTIVSPAELPIGILTAALGAPFFLWMLLRRRGLVDL